MTLPTFNRTLHIGKQAFVLQRGVGEQLVKLDILYPCGDMHDLHLSPDGPQDKGWEIEHVEKLVIALLTRKKKS